VGGVCCGRRAERVDRLEPADCEGDRRIERRIGRQHPRVPQGIGSEQARALAVGGVQTDRVAVGHPAVGAVVHDEE